MTQQIPQTSTYSSREGLIFFAAFSVTIVACIAVPRILSFMPAFIALLGLSYFKIKYGQWPSLNKTLGLFLGGFVILGFVSALWAPDFSFAVSRSFKNFWLLFVGLLTLAATKLIPQNILHKERVIVFLTYSLALCGIVLFFENITMFEMMRTIKGVESIDLMPDKFRNRYILNRSTVYLVLLSLPVTLLVLTSAMEKKKKIFCIFLMLSCVMLAASQSSSQTSQIAAVVAFFCLLYPFHIKKARNVILSIILMLIAAAPFLSAPAYGLFFKQEGVIKEDSFLHEASIPHRLEVWKFVSEKIIETPLFGNGVDSMRFFKAGYMMENMGADHVLHPHNAVLQIWQEFGAVGAILLMCFVIWIFRQIDPLPPLLQRYYMILFITILGVLAMGYGLWQAWLLGMIFAVVTMSIVVTRINSLKQFN